MILVRSTVLHRSGSALLTSGLRRGISDYARKGKGIVTTAQGRAEIKDAETKIAELLKKARVSLANSAKQGIGISEAKKITEEAHKIAQRSLIDGSFPKSIAVATILNDLGYFSKMEGDFKKAMELQNEAVQCYIRMNGADHPSTLTAMFNLGVTYLAYAESPTTKGMEKFNATESSKQMFLSLVEARRQMLREFEHKISQDPDLQKDGDVHKASERLRMDLSDALRKLSKCYSISGVKGQFAKEAESCLRESVGIMEETKDDGNVTMPFRISRALARNDLGLLHKRSGNYGEAQRNYEAALAEIELMLGPRHEIAVMIKHNLSELFEAEGFKEKATAIRNQLLEQAS